MNTSFDKTEITPMPQPNPSTWQETKRILVPIAFDPEERAVLRFASKMAEHAKAKLMLLHVVEPFPFISGADEVPLLKSNDRVATEALTELEQWASQETGGSQDCEIIVRVGQPDREILTAAQVYKADVVVLGDSAKNWFERFLIGSVSHKVKRRAACLVVTVADNPRRKRSAALINATPEESWRSHVSARKQSEPVEAKAA